MEVEFEDLEKVRDSISTGLDMIADTLNREGKTDPDLCVLQVRVLLEGLFAYVEEFGCALKRAKKMGLEETRRILGRLDHIGGMASEHVEELKQMFGNATDLEESGASK